MQSLQARTGDNIMIRKFRGQLGALCLTIALGATTAPADATTNTAPRVPTVNALPGSQPRGADVKVPHVVRNTFRFAGHRVRFGTTHLGYLGRIRTGHLVSVGLKKVVRVDLRGRKHPFRTTASGADYKLSEDRRFLYESDGHDLDGDWVTTLTVLNTRTGRSVARRTFLDGDSPITGKGNRVLMSDLSIRPDNQGTRWWNFRTNRLRQVSPWQTTEASLRGNRFAAANGDLYADGCTVVASFDRPDRVIWQGCGLSVMGFSPTGARFMTSPVPSDEAGFRKIDYRNGTGKVLARFRTASWFDAYSLTWESGVQPAIIANGARKAAWVRCTTVRCVNASKTWPAAPNY